jgi:uncharacterized protein (TIGR02145 family)
MKYLIAIILTISPILAQCDWNEDGVVDVLDIIQTVECIMGNGECPEASVYGCTDPMALNYNPNATVDDGSCEYLVPITDIDGNIYNTVMIGNQEWMAENLKVTHYRNSDPISTDYSNTEWSNLTSGAFSVYPWNNDGGAFATCDGDCSEIYGNLYNWYTVDDDRGICPEGWHVPYVEEWEQLRNYLGGNEFGGVLKSNGTIQVGNGLWYDPNSGATNETGFTGIPGGYRHYNGDYYETGYHGFFWSSTFYSLTNSAYTYYLSYNNLNFSFNTQERNQGRSIRCVKD